MLDYQLFTQYFFLRYPKNISTFASSLSHCDIDDFFYFEIFNFNSNK